MEISAISLILGKSKSDTEPQDPTPSPTVATAEAEPVETIEAVEKPPQEPISQSAVKGLDAIKDEEFKETLKKLGQSIADGEKSRF
jgi:hypothetical protein